MSEGVELGSGVRPFPAGQHSGAGRVVGQSAGGQQAGQLGHLRAVAVPALSPAEVRRREAISRAAGDRGAAEFAIDRISMVGNIGTQHLDSPSHPADADGTDLAGRAI